MFTLFGALLILLGILGLLNVIGLGVVVSIVLIAIGLAAVAYDRGAFRR